MLHTYLYPTQLKTYSYPELCTHNDTIRTIILRAFLRTGLITSMVGRDAHGRDSAQESDMRASCLRCVLGNVKVIAGSGREAGGRVSARKRRLAFSLVA